MKTKLLTLFLSCVSSIAFGQNNAPLTNEKIVEMVNAGIPEGVIITKIKNSFVNFTTDTPALKALNDAKVPESVVSAMIERSAAAPMMPAPSPEAVAVEKPRVESPPFTPYRYLSKQEQKLRMKSPAQVSIAAPMEKVSQLLVRAFQSWNYQLAEETSRSLTFTRDVKGAGAAILAGMTGNNNVRHKIQASMSEVSGVTHVIVNMWVSMDNAFGKTTNERINKKDDRAQLDDLLLAVKNAAERQ